MESESDGSLVRFIAAQRRKGMIKDGTRERGERKPHEF